MFKKTLFLGFTAMFLFSCGEQKPWSPADQKAFLNDKGDDWLLHFAGWGYNSDHADRFCDCYLREVQKMYNNLVAYEDILPNQTDDMVQLMMKAWGLKDKNGSLTEAEEESFRDADNIITENLVDFYAEERKHWAKCATRAGITLVKRDYNFGWDHPPDPDPGYNSGPVTFPTIDQYVLESFVFDVQERFAKFEATELEKKVAEEAKKKAAEEAKKKAAEAKKVKKP